eukprot:SAG31_NODE_1779_length_7293_cov_39.850153_5_plen_298_part_00
MCACVVAGVLALIRNLVIEKFLKPEHELVLWLDADVVAYPPDLVAQLYAANPGGIVAPMVYIEDSDTLDYHRRLCRRSICGAHQKQRAKQLYDRAAFVLTGSNVSTDKAFPGNSRAFPPYFGGLSGSEAKLAAKQFLDCESVGTVYLIPASVYRHKLPSVRVPEMKEVAGNKSDVHTNARVKHFPTAFTEHFPVVHFAKYELGMRVGVASGVEAFHGELKNPINSCLCLTSAAGRATFAVLTRACDLCAADLPRHGQSWHSEPMAIWQDWLQPYLGKSLADPTLRRTNPPEWFTDVI